MSRSGRRPIVAAPSRRNTCSAPVSSRKSTNGAPARSASRRCLTSRGVDTAPSLRVELPPRKRQPATGRLGSMRAGLIAGALLALAVTEPALGQAEVPCTNIGGGQFECSWYRAGDGKTGGAIVAVGTTTVGYLHQGRNWIRCEEKGGDMRNAEGFRNHWFGWTQADNGAWGWASALDASGGDNYGSFGGGTPGCGGAYGTPPSDAASGARRRRRHAAESEPDDARPSTPTRTASRRRPTATTRTRACTRARRRSSVTASTRTATARTRRGG